MDILDQKNGPAVLGRVVHLDGLSGFQKGLHGAVREEGDSFPASQPGKSCPVLHGVTDVGQSTFKLISLM